ncbi:MAG: HEAT repeat domain-containing protein, partial [Halobacteriota archaeon]
PLIKALGDQYSDVREAAALALGQLGDPRAMDPLNEALEDTDQRVQKAAAHALQGITEKNGPLKRAITIN